MSNETYAFKVGDIECFAINDGTFAYEAPLISAPADSLFANAPKKLLYEALNQHGIQPEKWMAFVSPFTCLSVDTGRHMVLADTGAGSSTPKTGRLLQNLQTVGIEAGDIDIVILTHAHEDHVGGNTDATGKPAFPKARYVMSKEEWAFWTSEQPEALYEDEDFTFIRRSLLSIGRQLDLVEREAEIVPGVRALAAPGHTPGHMVVALSSNGEQLLCIGDAFIHPIHIEHPEWHTSFDMAPERLLATRRVLLNKAASEKALMLASHFPFPGLGHVVLRGAGWQWKPI